MNKSAIFWYTTHSGSSLTAFRDNLSVPSSRVQKSKKKEKKIMNSLKRALLKCAVNFQKFGERHEHYWQIGPSGYNVGLNFAALEARRMVIEPQSAGRTSAQIRVLVSLTRWYEWLSWRYSGRQLITFFAVSMIWNGILTILCTIFVRLKEHEYFIIFEGYVP